MAYAILMGQALDRLKEMPDNSVHCCVTSPPYFGLRDYGVEGQIGLEKTPDEFIAKMVALFRELRRVLRDDGTLWLNMGDSYCGSWGNYGGQNRGNGSQRTITNGSQVPNPAYDGREREKPATTSIAGLKQKDLIGMPWRLALALQADGWWLRADIIWAKPNPMPSSVTDRPTTAHEYIFLLTKSAKYFYDEFAVREASVTNDVRRPYGSKGMWDMDGRPEEQQHGGKNRNGKNAFRGQGQNREHHTAHANRDDRDMSTVGIGATRNMRSVWTMATEPFPDAHFATFPTALPKKCIAAGTSERGVCPQCGAPWVRIVEKETVKRTDLPKDHPDYRPGFYTDGKAGDPQSPGPGQSFSNEVDAGWRAGCDHGAEPVPATVLDPFSGAATTGIVCLRMQRDYLGIELNPDYVEMSMRRLAKEEYAIKHPEMASMPPAVKSENEYSLWKETP